MDAHATLLASGSSLAPTHFGGVRAYTWFVSSLFFGDRAFVDLTVLSCVGPPPPVKPSTPKFSYASAVKRGQREQPAEQKPMASDPPSFRNTIPPSPRPTQQVPYQGVNYSSNPDPPENHDGSLGINESQNPGPHGSHQVTMQGPTSVADQKRSCHISPDFELF